MIINKSITSLKYDLFVTKVYQNKPHLQTPDQEVFAAAKHTKAVGRRSHDTVQGIFQVSTYFVTVHGLYFEYFYYFSQIFYRHCLPSEQRLKVFLDKQEIMGI